MSIDNLTRSLWRRRQSDAARLLFHAGYAPRERLASRQSSIVIL